MSDFRKPSADELTIIAALLPNNSDRIRLTDELKGLLVKPMHDGGMGSLLLLPEGVIAADRSFGRALSSGEFTDTDGVQVSVTLNADRQGNVYELDVWKVDFSPLLAWPDLPAIHVTRQ